MWRSSVPPTALEVRSQPSLLAAGKRKATIAPASTQLLPPPYRHCDSRTRDTYDKLGRGSGVSLADAYLAFSPAGEKAVLPAEMISSVGRREIFDPRSWLFAPPIRELRP